MRPNTLGRGTLTWLAVLASRCDTVYGFSPDFVSASGSVAVVRSSRRPGLVNRDALLDGDWVAM
jgi:hypothetical protein